MYNLKNKEAFLSSFSENTSEVYKRIFVLSNNKEEELNKDIFNFNEKELEDFIKEDVKPRTKQSARTYIHIISSYIQWAIDNKMSNLTTNPLRRRAEYFYSFVSGQNNLYLSKSEIDAIIYLLINKQDSFIIQGLFAGIQGNQVSELTSLTIQQVKDAFKKGNLLTLVNNKGENREIEVEESVLDLAVLANFQEEYYKKNGEIDYSKTLKDVVSLPKSNYILKPTRTNNGYAGDKAISHYTVYNRLETIKDLDAFRDYDYDALTTKNISRSGMIYEAKKMLDAGRSLDKTAITEICTKFGIKYKWSLTDFLNEETVRQVYEFEMK